MGINDYEIFVDEYCGSVDYDRQVKDMLALEHEIYQEATGKEEMFCFHYVEPENTYGGTGQLFVFCHFKDDDTVSYLGMQEVRR